MRGQRETAGDVLLGCQGERDDAEEEQGEGCGFFFGEKCAGGVMVLVLVFHSNEIPRSCTHYPWIL